MKIFELIQTVTALGGIAMILLASAWLKGFLKAML